MVDILNIEPQECHERARSDMSKKGQAIDGRGVGSLHLGLEGSGMLFLAGVTFLSLTILMPDLGNGDQRVTKICFPCRRRFPTRAVFMS